jgi:hypothetical protein
LDDIPKFDLAGSSVQTKPRDLVEEPTPQVIPYEIDESITTNGGEVREQLRVRTNQHSKKGSVIELA